MRVSVAVALASSQEVIEIEVDSGATVADALRRARIGERFPELGAVPLNVGIWSNPCGPETALRDGDRVEVYRELQADPKQQRRARAARPGRGKVRPSPRSRSGP
jgi:putative ubiquitin-RnfH superfamily antitoxin RatB of RatAB toxin-antitoxin module